MKTGNMHSLDRAWCSVRGRPRKYRMYGMEVGEATFIENDMNCLAKFQRKISFLAGREFGKGSYKTRRMVKHGKDGVSVERVA